MVEIICEYTQYAQKIMGENWFPYKFERAVGGVIMTGAICPLKRDGTPNFRKKDPSTVEKVIFPVQDVQ